MEEEKVVSAPDQPVAEVPMKLNESDMPVLKDGTEKKDIVGGLEVPFHEVQVGEVEPEADDVLKSPHYAVHSEESPSTSHANAEDRDVKEPIEDQTGVAPAASAPVEPMETAAICVKVESPEVPASPEPFTELEVLAPNATVSGVVKGEESSNEEVVVKDKEINPEKPGPENAQNDEKATEIKPEERQKEPKTEDSVTTDDQSSESAISPGDPKKETAVSSSSNSSASSKDQRRRAFTSPTESATVTKRRQVCRKSTAAEVARLMAKAPPASKKQKQQQQTDLTSSWPHGTVTRSFKRQHKKSLLAALPENESALSTGNPLAVSAELDRLRFQNPGRQNSHFGAINWTAEGGYMLRGQRRQIEMHSKLCDSKRPMKKAEVLTKGKERGSDPRLYDTRGLLLSSMEDRCDCMRPACPGCWLPCRRCHSTKCGPLCRIWRNFEYTKPEVYL